MPQESESKIFFRFGTNYNDNIDKLEDDEMVETKFIKHIKKGTPKPFQAKAIDSQLCCLVFSEDFMRENKIDP